MVICFQLVHCQLMEDSCSRHEMRKKKLFHSHRTISCHSLQRSTSIQMSWMVKSILYPPAHTVLNMHSDEIWDQCAGTRESWLCSLLCLTRSYTVSRSFSVIVPHWMRLLHGLWKFPCFWRSVRFMSKG